MRKTISIAAAALMIMTCRDAAAEGALPMSEADIRAKIVGSTLAGQYANGDSWREYFDPSGEIRGKDTTSGVYSARYEVRENYLCFDYLEPNVDWCGAVSIDGREIVFYTDKGRVTDPTYTILLEGNPFGM